LPWPDGGNSTEANACFRGGGFSETDLTRAFFVAGKRFRAAGFIATSFHKYVAEHFIGQVQMNKTCQQSVALVNRLLSTAHATHLRASLQYDSTKQ
jgi:hypothetical protein